MREIHKAAVIGAGTMGAGIASHLTNAGIPVLLLDIVPAGGSSRSAIAQSALERLRRAAPPAFMDEGNAALITTGNVEDHLEAVGEADWIVEAVVEQLAVKRSLYRALEAVRKPDAYVSSNTSTIPLSRLTEGMPADFERLFCITHFFNPVRYMRLLEIVSGPRTDPEVLEALARFCDVSLGKGVVRCRDTPGFLANRVGVYALQVAVQAAAALALRPEEADAIMGRPMGIPKTGVFALYDLIGLDLMLDVVASLAGALPATDDFHDVAEGLPLIRELAANGYTGNKGKGGFYRAGESRAEAIDLSTGRYRPRERPRPAAAEIGESRGVRAMVEHDDAGGRFAWHVLSRTLRYAAALVPETCATLAPIDEAMKLGYGWGRGPLELIDELGAAWFRDALDREGLAVPPILERAAAGKLYRARSGVLESLTIAGRYEPVRRPSGVMQLADVTKTTNAVLENEAASLWDVGDGVACLEFHSKANALGPASMALLAEALAMVERAFAALLIHNDAAHFSVGFDLDFVRTAAKRKAWTQIEEALRDFHGTCLAMRYAPFPVVAAPAGMSLGGGYEVLAHTDALQAHANTVMGLVETLVGLVPSGGGCKELRRRWSGEANDPQSLLPGTLEAFEIIGKAKTGASPAESARLRFMLAHDRATMNRDRLLAEAKGRALELAAHYAPGEAPTFLALGAAGRGAMRERLEGLRARGSLEPHDQVVGEHLAHVLCGGDRAAGEALSEVEMCALEREAFLSLVQSAGTAARIEHMLETGKPLRN